MKNKHLLSYLGDLFMAIMRLIAWTVRHLLKLIAWICAQLAVAIQDLMR